MRSARAGLRGARVDDVCDARGNRGVDDGPVLWDALARLAGRNEHHLVGSGERIRDGLGIVVVESHDLHALGCKVIELRDVAATSDDLGRRNTTREEGFDDEVSEVSGCTGDDDGHEN